MTDSRYKIIMRNGRYLRVRDRKMLRADVLELVLVSDEGLARKRIADAVGAQMNMVEQVLEDLLAAGEIDRYQARRPGRRRDDTYWCRVGFVAGKRVNRYHGAATLTAFQAAALMMLRGDAGYERPGFATERYGERIDRNDFDSKYAYVRSTGERAARPS